MTTNEERELEREREREEEILREEESRPWLWTSATKDRPRAEEPVV
jgi:hypothetical protein